MSRQTLRSTNPTNVLIDTDYGEEEEPMEIDFEDLVEEDIDPGLSHNYLKVGAEHMKSISKVHIKL